MKGSCRSADLHDFSTPFLAFSDDEMLAAVTSCSVAFAPAGGLTPIVSPSARVVAPVLSGAFDETPNSRRAALFNGASLAAVAAFSALPAQADTIEEIARRNNEIARKEREEKESVDYLEEEISTDEKLKPILQALGASVVLSVPFYCQRHRLELAHAYLPIVDPYYARVSSRGSPAVPLHVRSKPPAPRHQGGQWRRGHWLC
jgi:hypothetical protein